MPPLSDMPSWSVVGQLLVVPKRMLIDSYESQSTVWRNYLHTHLWHAPQSPLRLRCVVIMVGGSGKREFFVLNISRGLYVLVWNQLNIWKM